MRNRSSKPYAEKLALTALLGGLLLILSGFTQPLFAVQNDNENVGEVSAPFLQVSPSVRQAALGGFQAALRGSVDAMFSNPAGLSSLVIPELLVSHNQSFGQIQYTALSFAFPFRKSRYGLSTQGIRRNVKTH